MWTKKRWKFLFPRELVVMNRSTKIGLALLVVLVAALPATISAGYYSYSWSRTLSAPVPDGAFDPVNTTNATLRELFVANGAVVTDQNIYYDNSALGSY